MLFNSLDYALFLPIFFLLYWLIGSKNLKFQNILILIGSYIFYGFWDWRFLILIFLSSIIDYFAGIKIAETENLGTKKFYLWFSIIWNLGILFTFKYFNFFIDNFNNLFSVQNEISTFNTLNIILPVGLSFYTFQTMSYTIDVYRYRTKPTKKIIEFLSFVSFFPQLVAGPIERANYLLPQFFKERKFEINKAKEGLRQILWGLFKKVVVADNLGVAVDAIFSNPSSYQSSELFYGLILFFFQLYGDFSGYADIALGSAKLLGFNLHINFKLPHFATSVPEFWRRWNITLSQWFRDYVLLTFLKNKKKTKFNRYLGLIITFTLIGFWHGANWTFIIFGFIHSLFMIGYQIYDRHLKPKNIENPILNKVSLIGSILIAFTLTALTGAFFRGTSIDNAYEILTRIFSFIPDPNFESIINLKFLFLPLMIIMEFITRKKEYPFEGIEAYIPKLARWLIYYLFVYFIIRYGGPHKSFIYFQF